MAKTTKPNRPAPLGNPTSVRLPEEAQQVAGEITEGIGVGTQARVLRAATLYGLRAFQKNPKLVAKASKIQLQPAARRK